MNESKFDWFPEKAVAKRYKLQCRWYLQVNRFLWIEKESPFKKSPLHQIEATDALKIAAWSDVFIDTIWFDSLSAFLP